MAIYSLNLKSIGRTTHAAGTAGAHVLYIARPEARPELLAEHMPTDPNAARAFLNRGELADRKNARVADKVRIALPRELTAEQRRALVEEFARDLTGGRVPWFAGIHAAGKDAHNPHCHLVIRDRDIDTGKRVVRLSDSPRDRQKAGLEPKAVEHVRALWEDHANRALARAGHDVRIDRRSLEAQGIDRMPTIHIGPQAMEIDAHVARPDSKIRETGNGRTIDYPQIDAGRTRKERHGEIVDLNIEKAARSKDFRTRETAKLQRAQMALDRQLENTLIAEARARTREARTLRIAYREKLKAARQAYKDEEKELRASLRQAWQEKRDSLTAHHRAERDALKAEQGRIGARVLRVIDVTGRTRKRHNGERRDLQAQHRDARVELVTNHRHEKAQGLGRLADRYEGARRALKAEHAPAFEHLAGRHRQAEIEADRQRQMRAAERDQVEQLHEEKLRQVERMLQQQRRDRDRGRGFDIGR
ncbi:MAG: MobA/MobL family protein [Parvularcula sp.]|jgi:hypothetical protein|nr:MobA/MobL family protein [Parvularcula sp.]